MGAQQSIDERDGDVNGGQRKGWSETFQRGLEELLASSSCCANVSFPDSGDGRNGHLARNAKKTGEILQCDASAARW